MRRRFFFAAFLALSLSRSFAGENWDKANPNYPWRFPQDHWAHRKFKTEWWYFTGHLQSTTEPARAFAYQFTFFRIALLDQKPDFNSEWATSSLIMGHAALIDIQTQRHLFSSVLFREAPLLGAFSNYPEKNIAWSQAPAGTNDRWTLDWNGRAFNFHMSDDAQRTAFTLITEPNKDLIFEGPRGVSRKNVAGTSASEYYSFTRLETTGSVFLDGSTYSVTGQTWMDKEFSSNQLDKNQKGWDWFSLQFNDGRELMLYVMRKDDDTIDFAQGTLVSAASHPSVHYLSSQDFSIRSSGVWKSAETKANYPNHWVIEVPSEKISCALTPLVPDQENRGHTPGLPYWEGAVAITGNLGGRGFVELTGYSPEKN